MFAAQLLFFIAICQVIPFLVPSILNAVICIIIISLVINFHVIQSNLCIIISKRKYLILVNIMTLASLFSLYAFENSFLGLFIMSSASFILLGSWDTAKAVFRLFSTGSRNKANRLSVADSLAIIACHINQLKDNLSEGVEYNLTPGRNIFCIIVEAVTSFVVYFLRLGCRIEKVYQIRRPCFNLLYSGKLNLQKVALQLSSIILITMIVLSIRSE